MTTIGDDYSTRAQVLEEGRAEHLLRGAGIPLVPQRLVAERGALGRAAAALGYPVALKGRAPGLHHRTEAQAVVLGIQDAQQLDRAAEAMASRVQLTGYLVQPMVSGTLELIAGYLRDPVFGPTVLLGLGGVTAEADPDVSLRLVPTSPDQLASMADDLRARALLDGFRGAPPVDRTALVRLLDALGRLGAADPRILSIDLNPVLTTSEGLVAVDALVLEGPPPPAASPRPSHGAAPFFQARSVAVVGASQHPLKAGNVILRNLDRLGFRGRVHPVNPRLVEVEGLPCHPSLREVGEPIDLAVAVLPREATLDLVEDCPAAGVHHLIVSTAGFSDGGAEGEALEAKLRRRCAELGIRLMGPNSIGTVDVDRGLVTSLASIEPVPAGTAAYVGQTGLFASAFPRWFSATGRQGARYLASIGNKADVDEADLLDFLADDDQVRAVGAYLEGLVDGRRLFRSMERLCARKPLVVLKSGRTALGRRAASSHTGALASDDRVADAAIRQAGATRVDDFPTLFDQVRAFEVLPLPTGPRLGVVSITGVGCVLTADAVGRCGLELPELDPSTRDHIRGFAPAWAPVVNPVDMWSTIERLGATEAYRRLSRAVLGDPGVDSLLVICVYIPESELDADAVFGDLRATFPSKPVLCATFGGEPKLDAFRRGMERVGIPVFDDPARAVGVLSGLVRYARHRGLWCQR